MGSYQTTHSPQLCITHHCQQRREELVASPVNTVKTPNSYQPQLSQPVVGKDESANSRSFEGLEISCLCLTPSSQVNECSSKIFPLPVHGSIRSRPKDGQSLTCSSCSYNFQHPLLTLAKTSGNLVQDTAHMVIFLANLLKGCRISLSLSLLNLDQEDLS